MAVSDDLARLAVTANKADDRVAAAKAHAHDRLHRAVQEARDSRQHNADGLGAASVAAAHLADRIQCSWDEHLVQSRQRIDARKARLDAVLARKDAGGAAWAVAT